MLRNKQRRAVKAILSACAALALSGSARAASLYWDIDGATPGATSTGVTAPGTWNTTSSLWSTSATGNVATGVWVNGETAVFCAGADVGTSNSTNITVTGSPVAAAIVIEEGNLSFTGSITCTGTLTMASGADFGPSVRLNSSNTIGSITWNQGDIRYDSSNALGSGTVTMASGAGLMILACGASGTVLPNAISIGTGTTLKFNPLSGTIEELAGVISGAGGIVRDNTGIGTPELSGNNSFGGGVDVSSSDLHIGHKNALGSGTLTLGGGSAPATAIELQATTALTGANAVANAITVNQDFTVSGTNAVQFSGNVALAASTTRTITASNSGGTTFSGIISGSSTTLAKAGSSLLVLSGTNTYSGGTTISAGTLRGNQGVSVPTSGNVTITGGIWESSANITRTLGAGLTVSGASGFSARGGTVNVDMGGNGTGTGPQAVWGSASFSPTTLTLNASTADSSLHFRNALDLNGTTRTISVASASGVATIGGIISNSTGSAGLTKTGVGTLVLSANNTFNGNLAINAGTVQVAADAALGGGNVSMNSGTLATTATFAAGGARAFSISGAGGTFAPASGTTFTIGTAITGSGGLTKADSGMLTLTGASTYTGGTTIGAGTLQIGNGGAGASVAGNITNNGSLWFNHSGTSTHAGVISGTGTLSHLAGTLTLTGTNTYGDPTFIGGVLQVGSSNNLGNGGGANSLIMDGGTLRPTANFSTGRSVDVQTNGGTIDTAGNTLTIGGVISGSPNSFTKAGTGTLVLTGANTIVPVGGSITVSADVLQIGNGGTTGSITAGVSNSGVVAFNRSNNLTYGGVISGTGSVAKDGAGTLVLTAANTYSGGTTINAGTLQVGDGGTIGSITGDVSNGGTIAFNRSDNITYSGIVSGSGQLTKAGAGTLTLSAANTYGGATTVSAGTLRAGVASALPATTTVNVASGATLNLNNFDTTLGMITGGGSVTTLGSNLTIGGIDASGLFGGSITGSNLKLRKVGTGSWTISGNNTLANGFYHDGGIVWQSGGSNDWTIPFRIADAVGTTAYYVLEGGSITVANPTGGVTGIIVGVQGQAELTQLAGTTVSCTGSNGVITVGRLSGASALYDMQGGTINAGRMYVGRDNGAQGSFTQSGGNVTLATEFLDIGLNAGASGYASMSGGTFAAQGIYVGGQSTVSGGTGTLTINGGAVASAGTVRVWNTTGSSIQLQSGSLTGTTLNTSTNPTKFNWTGGTLRLTASLSISASGPLGANPTVPAAGTLHVANPTEFAAPATLTVASGSTLTLAPGATGTGRVDVPNISGKFDLKNNRLIVSSYRFEDFEPGIFYDFGPQVGEWNGTNYTGVTGLIRSGRNGGAWNGNGLVTSMSDAGPTSMLTTLGVATSEDLYGAGTAIFGGQTVSTTDTLIRYTFAGDADLDLAIDGDDFAAVDAGYSGNLKGWINGDFDYSGKVDADDYWLIDRNYSKQFTIVLAAPPAGVTSVPEPGGLALVAMAGLWGRRRKGKRS